MIHWCLNFQELVTVNLRRLALNGTGNRACGMCLPFCHLWRNRNKHWAYFNCNLWILGAWASHDSCLRWFLSSFLSNPTFDWSVGSYNSLTGGVKKDTQEWKWRWCSICIQTTFKERSTCVQHILVGWQEPLRGAVILEKVTFGKWTYNYTSPEASQLLYMSYESCGSS